MTDDHQQGDPKPPLQFTLYNPTRSRKPKGRQRQNPAPNDNASTSNIRDPSGVASSSSSAIAPGHPNVVVKAFREFCASTSLHGWQHLNVNSTGKFVWLLIVLATLGVASVFLAVAVHDFVNRSVVTTIETTTASLQVRLPT